MGKISRAFAAAGATVMLSAAGIGMLGTAAHAATLSPTCDAFAVDGNGNKGALLAPGNTLPALSIPNVGAGAGPVIPNATFPVNTASTSVALPGSATVILGGNPLTVQV